MKTYHKNREFGALNVYKLYWEGYLCGDLEAFSLHIDEDFEMIGTSEPEVCHSKNDGIDFFKAQMHEIVGRTEMRNREITTKEVNRMFLINEICDLYIFVIPEWTFYSRLRISTLLHETDSGWKVIQQHGSFPDMRVQEGETIAFDKITKENLELRDAVRRRTAELENKNRELAIEAALEKVRAVAMGMKNPNTMLDVCRVIAEQLEEFGVTKIRNVQTAIIDEQIGQYLCYQYFPAYGQTIIEDTEYQKSPVEHEMVRQMLASRDGHFTGSLSGKELVEFGLHRKEENHFTDPILDAASEVSYCFLSIGEGGLGLSLYKEMEAGVLELFKRFHQVFSLAYQRFRDIQKAEAQAREAQIEAALERVRAQTMAMHSSEDVGKSVVKMFSELTALGVDEGTRFGIGILNHENENNQLWTVRKNGEEVNMHIGNIDMASHPLLKSARKAWKEQIPFHKYVLEGEDLLDYYQMLNTAPDYKIQIPIEKLPKKEIQHCFIFEYGFFYAFSTREFQPELIQITKRFSSLFEQTYRRYLDLVRAETQARETQIEAALERVRSCSLAMHKSEELHKVIFIVAEQIAFLGISYDSVHFVEVLEDGSLEMWVATLSQYYAPKIFVPYLNHAFFNQLVKAKKEGFVIRSEVFDFEEKNSFFRHFFKNTIAKSTPEERKQFVFQSKGLAWSSFPANSLSLLIANYQAKPYSDQENEVFKRFANVFEQAYTRFLDLQKAEAQAREAQIEAGLERVRSKTMAMHNSKDVGESVATLFDELTALGFLTARDRCGIGIMQPDELMEVWTAEKSIEKTELTIGYLDMRPHALLRKVYQSWLDRKRTFRYTLVGEDKQLYADAITNQSRYKIRRDYFSSLEKIEHTDFFFEEGCLYVFSVEVISNESASVFARFVKVFGQTYRRYLDLQKAENQAREAQIEASLEKVRSRSLAMHSPD